MLCELTRRRVSLSFSKAVSVVLLVADWELIEEEELARGETSAADDD